MTSWSTVCPGVEKINFGYVWKSLMAIILWNLGLFLNICRKNYLKSLFLEKMVAFQTRPPRYANRVIAVALVILTDFSENCQKVVQNISVKVINLGMELIVLYKVMIRTMHFNWNKPQILFPRTWVAEGRDKVLDMTTFIIRCLKISFLIILNKKIKKAHQCPLKRF